MPPFMVLIETLWNVKMGILFLTNLVVFVLIETLWNVKSENSRSFLKRLSINRNIVECKDVREIAPAVPPVVLIETLWNVKYSCQPPLAYRQLRINRNIVECKVGRAD